MQSIQKNNLFPVYKILFSGCFMLFVYEPVLMYATNIDDLWFDFDAMIVPVLIVFFIFLVIGILLCTMVYYINKVFSKRITVYKFIAMAGSLLFFALYVQGNWLIKNLPPLDGAVINWSEYGKSENIIEFTIVIAIAVCEIIAIKKYGFDKTISVISNLSMVVFIMLSVALLTTVMNNDALKDKDKMNFSMDSFNNISEGKNFLIFMVDAVDSTVFNNIISNNPEYKNIFNDFTYYSDTASVYPCTRESVPLILTGYTYKNEEEYNVYYNDAFGDSEFFSLLKEGKYDINIYDGELIWYRNLYNNSCNVDLDEDNNNMNYYAFARQEMKYILFKYLPYNLKKYSHIHSMWFDICRKNYLANDNISIYNEIINNSELYKQSENMFQFIHAEGAHVPFDNDRELNIINDGTYEQKIEASITLLSSYIQRLKDNNAYDNSVIIILADHGDSARTLDEEILKRFNPILLIKGFNENHDFIESDIPVSHIDLQNAYHELLSGGESTELFKNIQYGRRRTFIWYRYMEEDHMIEYETIGNMKETEKFSQTGNVYDRK